MDPLPKTMKSWTITKNGPPRSVLILSSDRPVPPPPTGSDLLVKVSYAALNPADVKLMGSIPSWLPFRRNPVPGLDFSGTVVRAGRTAHAEFAAPGTPVCGTFGVTQVAFGAGSLAEYVLVPAHLVAVKPAALGMAGAAGLGVVGQTAVVMVRAAKVGRGDRVLINGASGGVGTILTQVLASKGAEVVAVCSGSNASLVRRLGAKEVVDYKDHDSLEAFLAKQYGSAPFNVIYDCVGSTTLFEESDKYLKSGSNFINIVGTRSRGIGGILRDHVLPIALGGTPRNLRHVSCSPTGILMKEVVQWVDDSLVKEVPLDSEFAMEDAVEAFERVRSQRSKGKVVVNVAG